MKLFDGWTREEIAKWLASKPDEPTGCTTCGAIAGTCQSYPNCPGNPDWKTKCGAPLDADGVDRCERLQGHFGVCGLDPV